MTLLFGKSQGLIPGILNNIENNINVENNVFINNNLNKYFIYSAI